MSVVSYIDLAVKAFFVLVLLSYYVLMILKKKAPEHKHNFKSITVLMPAHNEEKYIRESVQAVLDAEFTGKKEIIVIDDGSTDKTGSIVKKMPVTYVKTKHLGKSRALNLGIKKAKGELIAVIDGDSVIEKEAFVNALPYLNPKDVAAVVGTIKVKNNNTILGAFLHLEQIYNSLLRHFFSKINANIVTPGPLSIYKKEALLEVGGFGTKSFLEDVDVAVKLVRNGNRIEISEKSISSTYMPVTIKGFIRQRTRFARGWISILKRHLSINKTIVDLYSMPLAFFWFVQAIIMGGFITYQIISGYNQYFLSQGQVLSLGVMKFFFEWFTAAGLIRWAVSLLSNPAALTFTNLIGLASSLLSYPLYLLAILRYEKKFSIRDFLALFFMFPFWFTIMIIYVINIPELFRKHQENRWDK